MANKDFAEQKLFNVTSKKIVAELSTDTEQPITIQDIGGVSDSKRMRPDEFIEIDTLVNEMAGLLKLVRHPDTSITIKAARILLESLSDRQSLSPSTTTSEPMKSSVSSDIVESSATDKSSITQGSRSIGVKQISQSSKSKNAADSEGEIRIQQSKFNLDDIPLPGVLMSNWKNKINKNEIVAASSDIANIEDKKMKKDELDIAFERASKALRLLYLNDQKQLQLQVNEIISSIQSITANPKTDSKLVSIGR